MSSTIIKTKEHINEMVQFINSNDVLAFDIETNSLNVHTGKVIGFGVSNDKDSFYLPLYLFNNSTNELESCVLGKENAARILELLKTKKLIMHNGSFDVRFTRAALGIDLLNALYADTMLLKHTCDENFPFGLKEIATKLWGTDVTKEKEEMQASIKANGGTATQYYKADVELIGRYCNQDCLLTFSVFNHYLNDLTRQGLTEFYFNTEVMALYREVTIPMESHGVRLDIPFMKETLAEITQDIETLERGIQKAILPHLDLFTTWFLNKDYPLQTPTGKVPNWAKQGLNQYQAWSKDAPDSYMFNLQSKHHLKKLFFDTLKETPLSRTPTGLPQVDEDFIESMGVKYTWCKELIIYNKLNKIKSTYIEGILDEQYNGRFYASYKQHGTTSGRYASDMQQLPRPLDEGQAHPIVIKYTNKIRAFILPDEGCKLISSDYQQLEPSIFAHVSGDLSLQAIFHEGKDFYSEIAIRTEKLDGVSSDKKAPNFLGKVNKAARQKAKAYSLGVPYGLTGYKLKFMLECSNEDADQLIEDYLSAFPGLRNWMMQSRDSVKLTGKMSTQLGRVRHLPNAARLYAKYGDALDNDLDLWKKYNKSPIYAKAKEDRREYKNLLNNACNFQIQGLGASVMNRASIAIADKMREAGLCTIQVGQIHDELLFNSPVNEIEIASAIIKETMQNIAKLNVPLVTDPVAGDSFKECK